MADDFKIGDRVMWVGTDSTVRGAVLSFDRERPWIAMVRIDRPYQDTPPGFPVSSVQLWDTTSPAMMHSVYASPDLARAEAPAPKVSRHIPTFGNPSLDLRETVARLGDTMDETAFVLRYPGEGASDYPHDPELAQRVEIAADFVRKAWRVLRGEGSPAFPDKKGATK